MAVTKINNYSIGDDNLDSICNTVDKQRKGYFGISLTNWDNNSAPQVASGSVIEISGALYEFGANETITGSPSDGYVYIKIIPSSSTCTAEYTNTAPTWDSDKQGWYGTLTSANHRYTHRLYLDSGAYQNKIELMTRPPNAKLETVTYSSSASVTVAAPSLLGTADLVFSGNVLSVFTLQARYRPNNLPTSFVTDSIYPVDFSISGDTVTVTLWQYNSGLATNTVYYEIDITAVVE